MVSQDYTKAYDWYVKTHNGMNPDATFRVGRFLYHGLGLAKNYNDSLRCFESAHFTAEEYGEARCSMGMIWETGLYGVMQDVKKAIQY